MIPASAVYLFSGAGTCWILFLSTADTLVFWRKIQACGGVGKYNSTRVDMGDTARYSQL